MNRGITLSELAQQIESAAEQQSDMLVPAKSMTLVNVADKPVIDIQGHAFVGMTEWSERQVAQHLGIPIPYWRRMAGDDIDLLADNANHWLEKDNSTRLIRRQANTMRAFLSDRFKRIDHMPVLREALEAINASSEKVIPLSSALTDSKMHIKCLFNEREYEVKPGDTVRPGFYISNSEIGGGSFEVRGFLYRDYCDNGCVFGTRDIASIQRRHVGAQLQQGEGFNIFSNDTLEAEAQMLVKGARDVIVSMANDENVQRMVDVCRAAAESEPVKEPEKAVEVLARDINLTEAERAKTLINLIEDKDYTKWGMANAVTKVANTTENYDRATELESLGSQIMTMQMRQFERVRVAA